MPYCSVWDSFEFSLVPRQVGCKFLGFKSVRKVRGNSLDDTFSWGV